MQIMNFAPIAPELFLLAVIDLLALATVFMNRKGGTVSYQFSVLATAILSVWYLLHGDGAAHSLFSNLFVSDPLGDVLKAFSAGAFCVTLIYSRRYLEQRDMLNSDFFALALLSLLGQFVMISGANLLTLYLGLEMLSLASYALVAMRRDTGRSSEAGIKYFILGALASGFLLYGMSMLYGATGSLDLKEIFAAIAPGKIPQLVLVFGLVFVVAGLAFKLGAAPFHMWVPDVYQGAPTAVTLLVAGAPKLAAFAMVIRLLVQGLLPLALDWQQMLMVLAVLSLVIGNLTAIAQTNLKRMLAYSTISHMGFMLLGLLSGVFGGSTAGTTDAYSNAMFYAITYVLTTLGTFGVMLLLSRAGFEAEEIADLKGLNQRSPWFAFVMLLLMFSLAGIPPTVGFYAKLAVLQSVADAGMLWLAVVAVMMSLIGAFYYLRVVKTMYFDAPVDTTPLDATLGLRGVLSINGILVVALGLAPTPLLALCLDAVRKTLG